MVGKPLSSIRRKLGIEWLEQRRLLAVIDWDGGGDGKTWHDAANWSATSSLGRDSARIAATFPRVEIRQNIDLLGVEALSGLSVFDSQMILRGNTQIDNGSRVDRPKSIGRHQCSHRQCDRRKRYR